MYGLLAVCAAVVLATRGDDEPESDVLRGRTERGQAIEMVLQDGTLHSVRTRVPVYCPEQRVWRSIRWTPVLGSFGQFRQEGERFAVRQQANARRTAANEPDVTIITMRGRLAGDAESARGTMEGIWQWERFICRATVRFSAD